MHFLVSDGNSLINRAFYGIRLLTAKDGHYTNAIFGFMNMLLSLEEQTKPEAIAVAFDLKAPTFRHKMYDGYKAGRKPMPPELREQMEPLKELLKAYGCHIVECEGYEADDILGTLSAHTPTNDFCFIATGDRDSLQLVRDNVNVLLTTTKMGQTNTVRYNKETLFAEYGLTPAQMIELKALQGDNSDNIPGVAGVGPKTAGELIKKYHTIDEIYADPERLEVTAGVKAKLIAGKENAFLSRTLGTICLEAPVETDISAYLRQPVDAEQLKLELAKHEMFKMISRLKLETNTASVPKKDSTFTASLKTVWNCEECVHSPVFFDVDDAGAFYLADGTDILFLKNKTIKDFKRLLEDPNIEKWFADSKKIYRIAMQNGIEIRNTGFDFRLAAYVLNPNASAFSVSEIALSYHIPLPEIAMEEDVSDETLLLLKSAAAAMP